MKKVCLIMLFLLFAGGLSARAYDGEVFQNQLDLIGGNRLTGAVDGTARGYLDGIAVSPNMDVGESFLTVLERALQEQSGALRAAVRSLTKVMLVIILCGCASGIYTASTGKNSVAVDMAGALGVTSVLLSDMRGMMALSTGTLDQVSVFSKTMLPVMAAAISLTGKPTAATVLQAATMFAFDLLIRFVNGVLVPAVCAYIAIITVNAAMGNDMLGKLAGFVKWITTASLKLILTLFIGYITLSSSISSSIDAVALKAARFAVSGTVPVVGGIISDATETMLSGAVLLKNAVGIMGMLCITAICLVPFLQVGLNYLLFKAGAAVLSPVCSKNLSSLLSGISDSFGLLLGMLGTCSAIIFFELVFSVALVNPS